MQEGFPALVVCVRLRAVAELLSIPSFRVRVSAARLMSLQTKGYTPPDKWTAAEFRRRGGAMRFALARAGKIVVRKALPGIRAAARNVMLRQVEAIEALVEQRIRKRGKAADPLSILVSVGDESIWLEAMKDVFGASGGMLEAELSPILTSVASQGFSKTQRVLGVPPDKVRAETFRQQTARIGARITGIDDFTKEKVRAKIRSAMDEEGATLRDVAGAVRESMGSITESRVACIARTESANVWNIGSTTAMKQVPGLEKVDVIGCESRERERWGDPSFAQFMYRGEGTCNIKGVPIEDAHLLVFHPNHTGAIVPGSFSS